MGVKISGRKGIEICKYVKIEPGPITFHVKGKCTHNTSLYRVNIISKVECIFATCILNKLGIKNLRIYQMRHDTK